MRKLLVLALLWFSPVLAEAPTQNAVNVHDTIDLTPAQESEARNVASEIKCPVCKGESILTSSSDLSRQIYLDIQQRIQTGETPDQIKAYLVSRYGETVLLNPPKKGLNWLLWLAPIGVLAGSALGLHSYLKRASAPPEMSDADLERVERYLKERES